MLRLPSIIIRAVSNGSKILKWKQITTDEWRFCWHSCCFQWFKDTKMKANHNRWWRSVKRLEAVSNGSKILKWKQITTCFTFKLLLLCCFQWFKDTKMKANHNPPLRIVLLFLAVSNGSKILKWKQITTSWWCALLKCCCFQWFKDTKMKANHNSFMERYYLCSAVSNGSKILKWKQITTNTDMRLYINRLFPMVQRY